MIESEQGEAQRRLRVGRFMDAPGLHYKRSARGVRISKEPEYGGRPAEVIKFLGRECWAEAPAYGPFDVAEIVCHTTRHDAYGFVEKLPVREGGAVTFSLVEGGRSDIEAIERLGASAAPLRRPDRHIGRVTRGVVVDRILEGQRFICRNVVCGSPDVAAAAPPPRLERLAGVFKKIHAVAAAGEPVVCAIVGLQRSGSTSLADFVSLSVPLSASVFHEHAIPKYRAGESVSLSRESDVRYLEQVKLLLAEKFANTHHRFVFVTEREPQERIVSLFARARRRQLSAAFRPVRQDFDGSEAIVDEFLGFAEERVEKMRLWYERHWPRAIGFRLSELSAPGDDGYAVLERGGTTVVLIRTAALDRVIRHGLQESFGAGNYPIYALNSAADLGYREVYDAFRRLAHFPAELEARLQAIPEVSTLHGAGRPD